MMVQEERITVYLLIPVRFSNLISRREKNAIFTKFHLVVDWLSRVISIEASWG